MPISWIRPLWTFSAPRILPPHPPPRRCAFPCCLCCSLPEPAQHAAEKWKAASLKEKIDLYINDKTDVRTYEALRRERSTFFVTDKGPAFTRWLVILPVLAVQICMGSLYCWSIFNKTMDKVWVSQGYKTGANANAFTIAVAFFGYGAALYGPWISRYGSFYSVRNTLICLPLGWAGCCLATSANVQSLGLLYASCIFMGTGESSRLTPVHVVNTDTLLTYFSASRNRRIFAANPPAPPGPA